MSRATSFRPFLFGEQDRRIYRVDMGEVSLRAVNNASGSPTYLAYAQVGVSEDEPKWQIRKITYDANDGVTKVEWPEDSDGAASNNYEFIWSDYLTYTYR